jgi:hypothetical protein
VRSWTEWFMVETAINMDIDWIFLKEPTLSYILNALYPYSTVMMWKEGVVLPKVYVLMCSQWIPPKTQAVWKSPELKLVLAQVASPMFKSWLGFKYFPLRINHQEVGGMTDAEVLLRDFSKIRFTLKKVKHQPPRMVSSYCKDHHFGREVDSQQSLRALKPEVVRLSEGIYHGDGVYPAALVKPTPMWAVIARRFFSLVQT